MRTLTVAVNGAGQTQKKGKILTRPSKPVPKKATTMLLQTRIEALPVSDGEVERDWIKSLNATMKAAGRATRVQSICKFHVCYVS